MITEDYVSFEVAKLLKEKGFDELTCGYYYDNYIGTLLVSSPSNHSGSINAISAPSQGHVMKWLREMYGLMIVVHPSYPIDGIKYESLIYRLTELKDASVDEYNYDDKEYDNYEQACESAIKYCLTNLI